MSDLTLLTVASWPEKLGTSWYAIGGALGILLLVLIGLVILAHIHFPDSDKDAGHDA